MRHIITNALILSATVALLQGCERRTPDDSQSSQTPSTDKPTQAEAPTEMVPIAGGKFTMGDKTSPTPRCTRLWTPSYGRYLVTLEQYESLMGDIPPAGKAPSIPSRACAWSDAVKFCKERSRRDGLEPCYNLETWECNFDPTATACPRRPSVSTLPRGRQDSYFFGDSATQCGLRRFVKNSAGALSRSAKRSPSLGF